MVCLILPLMGLLLTGTAIPRTYIRFSKNTKISNVEYLPADYKPDGGPSPPSADQDDRCN